MIGLSETDMVAACKEIRQLVAKLRDIPDDAQLSDDLVDAIDDLRVTGMALHDAAEACLPDE